MSLTLSIMMLTGGALCVVASFRLCLRRPWRTYPACGACGYPIHGLTSSICPECGSDRGMVGIAQIRPKVTFVEGLLLALGSFLLIGGGMYFLFG